MKKIIFILAAVIMSISAFSQKTVAKPNTDTVFVDISKSKVIAFVDSAGHKPFKSVDVASISQLDHIAMPKVYWWQLYDLLLSAKTGLSAKELETYYRPFAIYAQQYEYALQMQQQQQQQKKQ